MARIIARTALIGLGAIALISFLWILARAAGWHISEGFMVGLMAGAGGGVGGYFANQVARRKKNTVANDE
jgi:hypothetical protein